MKFCIIYVMHGKKNLFIVIVIVIDPNHVYIAIWYDCVGWFSVRSVNRGMGVGMYIYSIVGR